MKCVPVRDKLTYEITKFEWDQAPDNFKCVDSITIALGGIDENFSYLNDVEIIAPNMKCHNEKLPAYPIKVGNTKKTLSGPGTIQHHVFISKVKVEQVKLRFLKCPPLR